MRRTAWNHIWIPYDQIGLEDSKSQSPPHSPLSALPPTRQTPLSPQSPPGTATGAATEGNEAEKGHDAVVAAETIATNEPLRDADWDVAGQGLKVWLRRTFIFQLMSVPDRY